MFAYFHQFPINLSGVRANMNNLLVAFGFGQSNHLPSEQVARSLKHPCLEIGAVDHRVWLAPVPPPKGKSILFGNSGIVKPLSIIEDGGVELGYGFS